MSGCDFSFFFFSPSLPPFLRWAEQAVVVTVFFFLLPINRALVRSLPRNPRSDSPFSPVNRQWVTFLFFFSIDFLRWRPRPPMHADERPLSFFFLLGAVLNVSHFFFRPFLWIRGNASPFEKISPFLHTIRVMPLFLLGLKV